jgi:hypothetical protein
MAATSKNLHNNHNVYVLGAGFSRLRGLPLVSDFMSFLRDALEYHARLANDREVTAIERVLEFRLKAASAAYRVHLDLENIEELFSLASASLGQLEESIKVAIAATLDYAVNSTPDAIAQFRAEGDMRPRPRWQIGPTDGPAGYRTITAPAYEFIIHALLGAWDGEPSTENTFITFNYDDLVERALTGLQVGFELGLGETKSIRQYATTRVLKLHGSANWTVPKGAKTRVEATASYRSLMVAGLVPELIPPTWKKDSKAAFNNIWDMSLRALCDATRVVVIGFSMPETDLHFKYLLAAGLQDNFSLREIVFVNPRPGLDVLKNRCDVLFANLQHNAANVRFIDSTLEAFVGQGTGAERVASIGRPLPPHIQHVAFARAA